MNANQIEIHYFLPEAVHSADAYKLVKAETEFISIIKEIACTFDIEFTLETQALAEGGIKQVWKAIGDRVLLLLEFFRFLGLGKGVGPRI